MRSCDENTGPFMEILPFGKYVLVLLPIFCPPSPIHLKAAQGVLELAPRGHEVRLTRSLLPPRLERRAALLLAVPEPAQQALVLRRQRVHLDAASHHVAGNCSCMVRLE